MKTKELMMNMINVKKYTVAVTLFLLAACVLHAQKKHRRTAKADTDTLLLVRNFINISNGYKQSPLHLDLDIKNSTNFISAEEDTATVHADFYIGKESSYVHVGEFEQVVNDSVALLVSDRLKQMILYTDAAPVVQQMKSMMGASFPDSSVRNLARTFSSVAKDSSAGSATIELSSRDMLYGTSLPRETIELQYNVQKNQPQQVKTIKRTLIRLDSLHYTQLQQETGIAEKLLALEGNYFLVKEQFTAYVYNEIGELAMAGVPVQVSDRVMRNERGEYTPAKKYGSYRLSKN